MRVVIIGGGSGIGAATARRLADAGHELLLCGRTEEKVRAIATELRAASAAVDARHPESLQETVSAFGPIDGVVNCAGSILLKPAHLTSLEEWNETLSTNLTTAFATVRVGARAMMQTGGSIVLMATAAARAGFANHEAIAAAKGGVMGLMLSAAATYAPRNIRVNCVAPGLVDTPLASRITGNEAARKASESLHALGRVGRAEEVASAIVWLLTPENAWVTGQTIGVDGGLGTLRAR